MRCRARARRSSWRSSKPGGRLMQVKAALALARSRGVERLDAQLLLSHALAQSRSWLIAHDDHPLAPSLQQHFVHSVERRAAGEPLAYLIGEREFHGLRFVVSPAVLVPRPETELLVDWSLAVLRASEAARSSTWVQAVARLR